MSGWDRNDPDEWGKPGRGCAVGVAVSGGFWFIAWLVYLWVTR